MRKGKGFGGDVVAKKLFLADSILADAFFVPKNASNKKRRVCR